MSEAATIAATIANCLPGTVAVAGVGAATEINGAAFLLLTTASGELFSCSLDRIENKELA